MQDQKTWNLLLWKGTKPTGSYQYRLAPSFFSTIQHRKNYQPGSLVGEGALLAFDASYAKEWNAAKKACFSY
jgi:hypothetical protein